MKHLHRSLAVLALGLFAGSLGQAAEPATPAAPAGSFSIVKTLKVGGEGKWDYLITDPAAKLIYISRSTHMQVVKMDTGELAGDLDNTKGIHGIALVADQNRGFTSNGGSDTATVFDLKTLKAIGTIPTGKGPDAIIYEPFSKKVFTMNGKSADATVIDPAAAPGASAVVATIPLGGRPEFAASDEAGHLYINLEDKSSVVAIDTKTMKVTHTWKLVGGDQPSGLAIDIAHHRLFCGCVNKVMAVVDTETGKTIGTFPIGTGVDACAFDPATGEAFASCGDGTLTVGKESAGGKFDVVQTVTTRKGGKTMGFDATTHTVYVPANDAAAGGFVVMVIARPMK